MSPALLGRVIGAPKPSLIPAENLVSQTGGVDLDFFLWRGFLVRLTKDARRHHDSQKQSADQNDALAPSQMLPDALARFFMKCHWSPRFRANYAHPSHALNIASSDAGSANR